MSGIEVAGIVLAVLPLFISAWEHYDDGLNPAKAALHWETQLPSHVRALRTQQHLYQASIQQLVAPVTTPQERAALLEKCYDALWTDGGIQRRINERLGDAQAPFKSIMEDFEQTCRKIADYLDIEKEGHSGYITQDSLEAVIQRLKERSEGVPSKYPIFFQKARRLKFGWSKKRITALLKELEKCNYLLDKIVGKVDILDSYRVKPKKSALQHLVSVQKQACKLAQLERRLTPSESKRYAPVRLGKSSPDCLQFRFAFTASHSCQTMNPAHWHELEIAVSEAEPTQQKRSSAVRVAFAEEEEAEPDVNTVDVAKLNIIRSLCPVFASNVSNRPHAFFFDCRSQSLRGFFPGTSLSSFTGQGELVRLGELLPHRRTASATGLRGLSKRQRMVLAATLASSALQLHSTCFSRDWSKRAISFIRSHSGQPDFAVEVDRPLLMRSFSSQPNSAEHLRLSPEQTKRTMLSLGALLLELHSGETIESRMAATRTEFSGVDEEKNMFLACQAWLAEERENMSESWVRATSTSLMRYFDPLADIAEPNFRKLVHDEIVCPLDEDARNFVGAVSGG